MLLFIQNMTILNLICQYFNLQLNSKTDDPVSLYVIAKFPIVNLLEIIKFATRIVTKNYVNKYDSQVFNKK